MEVLNNKKKAVLQWLSDHDVDINM